ncbi:alpha-hydroxy-acid oxidizing enzyme [Dictyobacter sp. S3.2.2.5]|uniref:Alpha-hydroxy-acid oxidizing enzyme n=1 Tax=Dictyobacter halimunensis TaxID=3026934 RepID=A0ABQ6FQU8_9CHLR|nr:alpha-hydroxy-acid oxidizing enzyme [Dictyobacter sp. S3.2.2.5]GLV54870.1 alpha-hydroxy-acid oxidizing enzyme [Dictyobacter sp. S3.2.2.5]
MMQPINLHDYEMLAQKRLQRPVWDYYQGGSDDEISLRNNRAAFAQLRLRPRVLVDVNNCNTATSVLTRELSMPILVAPTAAHGMAHSKGECETIQGADAVGSGMIVSNDASRSMEEVAKVSQGLRWYQLYIRSQPEARQLVKRAEAAGYQAIVLTVDTPLLSRRERDIRNKMGSFQRIYYPGAFTGNVHNSLNGSIDDDERAAYVGHTLSWDIIAWLRTQTSLPIILKGILTAEDAVLAVQHGVEGIIVSNHGGRQLDGAIAPIEALPEIVAAVDGRCPVYLDGGIRRGTDVLKALALGAQAVMIGRPILWGLAVGGSEGVKHVLQILQQELRSAMVLVGSPTVKHISRSLIQ